MDTKIMFDSLLCDTCVQLKVPSPILIHSMMLDTRLAKKPNKLILQISIF